MSTPHTPLENTAEELANVFTINTSVKSLLYNNDLSEIGAKGNFVSLTTIGVVRNFKYSDYRFLYIALRTASYSSILDSTLVPTDILPNSGVTQIEIGRYESPNYALTGLLVFDSSSVQLHNLISTGDNNFSDLLVYGIK